MQAKAALRRQALAARAAVADRMERSAVIGRRVLALQEFRHAATVAAYVGVRDEVATADLITAALGAGKRVAVPWCDGDELRLAAIDSLEELAPAAFGLLEPPPPLRQDQDRNVAPESIELLLIPGVAFDRQGGRLGYGRGYYDRLLPQCRPAALRVGLAFECQLFDRVPAGATDERVDCLVTEAALYRFNPRAASRAP